MIEQFYLTHRQDPNRYDHIRSEWICKYAFTQTFNINRLRHKVNFYAEFNRFEVKVFLFQE